MAYVAGLAIWQTGFPASVGGSLNVGSNANRRIVGLFCHVGSDSTADIAATDITYAGSSTGVTLAPDPAHLIGIGGNEKCRWFHIDVPAGTTGSNTLSIADADNAGNALVLIAVSYDGISGVSAVAYGADAFNNNPTITIASATGEEVVGLLLNYGNDGALFVPGAGTSMLAGFGVTDNLLAFREDGASSVTIDGTWVTSHGRVFAAFSLQQGAAPPTITAQPVGSAAAVGATAQYSITETGGTSYQWQVSTNGGETWAGVSGGSGATSTTYTTPATVSTDNGKQYRCVVTGSGGSTNSLGAWFHVSGIGLTYRGRGTSRVRYSMAYTDVGAPHLPFDPRNGPGSGSVKEDAIASAFRALYFDVAPAAPPRETPHWTWSARNRPGSGPLSTGAFFISQRPVWAPAISSDVSVAIVGIAGSGVAGALGVAVVGALSGVAATGDAGALVAAATSATLAGVSTAGAVGAVAASASGATSGVAAAGAIGLVGVESAVAVAGVAGTAVAGSALASIAPVLAGASAAGTVGAVGSAASVALTGSTATGALGAVAPQSDGAIGITGVTAAAATGSLAPSISAAIATVATSGGAGALAASAAVAVTGLGATGSVGAVAPSAGGPVAITGIQATASPGDVGANITTALATVLAAGSLGSVVPNVSYSAALSGLASVAGVGSASAVVTVAITGVGTIGVAGAVVDPSLLVFSAQSRLRIGSSAGGAIEQRIGRSSAGVAPQRIGDPAQ